MALRHTHIKQDSLPLVATILSDLARLTLRALSTADRQQSAAAADLLDCLLRVSGAPRGGLVMLVESDTAAATIQPLALIALTVEEAETLLATPLREQHDIRVTHEGAAWLRYELPTQATAAVSRQGVRAIALLGWREDMAESDGRRVLALLDAVAEASGAVVAALLHEALPATVASERAENTSHGTESEWEQIFDAVADPMCVVTADYRLERANAAYIKLFGLNRHGIPGHECFSLHPGQNEPCANCPLPNTIRSGQAAFVQQEQLVPTSGSTFERRTYQRWIYPIFREDGTVDRIVEILKDVTDQERARKALSQAEALREADRLKSELLGTVSHELRSPLTTIKGYAATLLRHERHLPREERHEFLTAIVEASNSLQVIIDRLLEMSQIETGALRVEHVDVNLQELARAALDDIEHASANSQEHFDFVLLADATVGSGAASPWEVEGDPRLLREVLDNLLENAVKYSPTGGRIEVKLSSQEDLVPRASVDVSNTLIYHSSRTIELVVSDTGMGIPQEHLEQIFERFHRVDTRLTREVGGLGLGLAICQRIVERHDGIIWAESVPGQGSSFHVQLPAAGGTLDATA